MMWRKVQAYMKTYAKTIRYFVIRKETLKQNYLAFFSHLQQLFSK